MDHLYDWQIKDQINFETCSTLSSSADRNDIKKGKGCDFIETAESNNSLVLTPRPPSTDSKQKNVFGVRMKRLKSIVK